MTDPEIRYLGDVRKFDLGPNDVIVIEVDQAISDRTSQRITEYVREILGPDRKVLILGDGLKLGVVSVA